MHTSRHASSTSWHERGGLYTRGPELLPPVGEVRAARIRDRGPRLPAVAGNATPAEIHLPLPEKYDLLLRVSPIEHKAQVIDVSLPRFSGLGATAPEQLRVSALATQRGSVVRNLERLVLLGYENCCVPEAAPPTLWFCNHHNRTHTTEAKTSGACVPLSVGVRGEYLLLWGAGDVPDNNLELSSSDSEDSEFYSQAPLVRVYNLMEQEIRRSLSQENDTVESDEGWWQGGAMQRLAAGMARTQTSAAFQQLAEKQAARIQTGSPLLNVFDFVSPSAPFEALRFVLDARRSPLAAGSDREFEERYGLPTQLSFTRRTQSNSATLNLLDGIH